MLLFMNLDCKCLNMREKIKEKRISWLKNLGKLSLKGMILGHGLQ
jgi:hypothetical protein